MERRADASRYRVSPQFILRSIAGESILVPVGEVGALENCMITLNDTCHFVWKQFVQPRTVEEVIAMAEQVFTDPSGTMAEEIRQVVLEYCKVGLLREE